MSGCVLFHTTKLYLPWYVIGAREMYAIYELRATNNINWESGTKIN